VRVLQRLLERSCGECKLQQRCYSAAVGWASSCKWVVCSAALMVLLNASCKARAEGGVPVMLFWHGAAVEACMCI
jgi:hypothetical protein